MLIMIIDALDPAMHDGEEAECGGPLEDVLRGCQQTRHHLVAVRRLLDTKIFTLISKNI